MNKLKDSFGSQVEKLTAENAQLRGHVQQSAEQSQQVSQQQNSAMWDDIASRVPGLVEYYGKPSQALASPGSIQDQRWGALRDAIYRSANNQGVPSQYVDLDKATADAFAFLQPTQVNTNGTGQNGHPGRAVGGDYRIASQPAPPGTLSVGDDYDQRVAAVNRVIQQRGGRGI